MCNLYFQTQSQDGMRHVFGDLCADDGEPVDLVGNLPPMAGIFTGSPTPIIRPRGAGGIPQGWQVTKGRPGMLTQQVFLKDKPSARRAGAKRPIPLFPQARAGNGLRAASWPAPASAQNRYVQGALA